MSRFQTLSDGVAHECNDRVTELVTEPVIRTTDAAVKRPNAKILAIQNYFGVSEQCAAYLYYRRKRGTPWKTSSDPKYLEWSVQLQNAIIWLDTVSGFKWSSLEFGFEDIQFMKYNIEVRLMPKTPSILNNSDGFTLVNNKHRNTKMLNRMGLLPKSYIAK